MTETEMMPAICYGWKRRASALNLKKGTVKYRVDMEAYMQGALSALSVTGLMTHERAGMIAFLTAVDRLPDFVENHATKYEVK